ncbi:MAG: hypothetical protein CMH25_02765 [Micavibrio sp.]|nr:hypothetical protein [Micavibrio sp.]|tara:strand:- start:537913 stop:538689 length:777 start_codon:yes stop_codon:yes gene_type:complete
MFHRPKTNSETKSDTSTDAKDNNSGNEKDSSTSKVANTNQTAMNLEQDKKETSKSQDSSKMATETKSSEATTPASRSTDIPESNSPFKKAETASTPTASAPRTPGTPGAYGTYNPTPYAASSTPAATTSTSSTPSPSMGGSNGRRLVIGEGINMSGEIESCEHLLVEGTVEAALKGAKVVEISQSGVFYGTVEIEQATVAGRFEGDITVSGRLMIKSSGSVTGKISYGELAIEAGGTLDGTLTPLNKKAGSDSMRKAS